MKARLHIAAVAVLALLFPASASAVSREFYGVVPSGSPSQSEFRTMGQGNVGTFRFQLSWRSIQRSEGGAYDWSGADELIGNAAANGIELLPFVYGTPSFAGATSRTPPLGSAADKQAFKEFLTAAWERYGPGGDYWTDPTLFLLQHPGATPRPIDDWQIWNEVNSPTFYEPKPSVKGYAELLRISDDALSSAARSSGRGADIVLGGMFGTPRRKGAIFAWKYLKRLYKTNAEGVIDAIALHPYSPNLGGIKAQIKLARQKIKKAGGGKPPIWITEIGWGSAGTKGHDLIKSRAGQKKMLRKSFKLLRKKRGKWKIRRALWFAWRDPASPNDSSGTTCTWCSSAGLFDRDLDPKPSWDQFRRLTRAG